MTDFNLEYIIDKSYHKKAVILPLDEWEAMLSKIEELEEIRAYDAAKADNDEIISFEQAVNEIRNIDK